MWDDLVCPHDQGRLVGTDWLSCQECGRGYPVLDSLPTFLPEESDPRWAAAQRRALATLPRLASGELPWSPPVRQSARRLERTLLQRGLLRRGSKVLQIGPHGQGEVHFLRGITGYAIDPLAGLLASHGMLRWGQVRWVSGRGEELPFPQANFDVVLLSDVLPWVESPQRVLAEARRCLAPQGTLVLMASPPGPAPFSINRPHLSERLGHGGPPLHQLSPARLLELTEQAGFRLSWLGADRLRSEGRRGGQSVLAPPRDRLVYLCQPSETFRGPRAATQIAEPYSQ